MSLFCWTQRKIFWRMWETEQFWGTIDFHSIPPPPTSPKTAWLRTFFKRNSYGFGTTWVSKWWLNFHFWVIREPLLIREALNCFWTISRSRYSFTFKRRDAQTLFILWSINMIRSDACQWCSESLLCLCGKWNRMYCNKLQLTRS